MRNKDCQALSCWTALDPWRTYETGAWRTLEDWSPSYSLSLRATGGRSELLHNFWANRRGWTIWVHHLEVSIVGSIDRAVLGWYNQAATLGTQLHASTEYCPQRCQAWKYFALKRSWWLPEYKVDRLWICLLLRSESWPEASFGFTPVHGARNRLREEIWQSCWYMECRCYSICSTYRSTAIRWTYKASNLRFNSECHPRFWRIQILPVTIVNWLYHSMFG